MRSFLLFLSLMTGCEASSEASKVKGCRKGWVEFTCKYPTTETYKHINVVIPKKTTIKSTKKDVWEKNRRISLYHDTKSKTLRVAIKQIQQEDSGTYTCKFNDNEIKKLELEVETDGCQRQFIQTAYRTAKTTITCDYTGKKYKFFCKDNGFICEDILSTKSSLKSKGTFTLTETNSSFSVSISNVSSHDAGVYWCGVETREGSYRAALRKIKLEVKAFITNFTKSPTVGQNLTYYCKNRSDSLTNMFICKGEDPSICQPLVSTSQPNKNTGKFSMKEDKDKKYTITVREVTTDDTGTYWCGAETTNETRSNKFFHKMVMTVGGSQVVVTVIVCVAVLLLLFVLMLILIYKRFSHLKNTRKQAAAQNLKEEFQQHIQKPDSGNEMNWIFASVNSPTNPSALLYYSTVYFQSSSACEALIVKPGSAACEYSTVMYRIHSSSRFRSLALICND
ncbi:polymeric immunoglobulin receptor-like [Micropterus salmoides]|uniref:polymeric immunoglobulin receptor-like n=1 Tax=Micropterus salmoides TaxID=27706 RepID=UPI0018EC6591|nr:polymeric immunoglobulin receptor-like [Micropterus salmoides]